MVLIAIAVACLLAFANGANDNAKGVATLVGARIMSSRTSLTYAAVATFLGSAAAILLAGALVGKFSGKGLVDERLLASPVFLGCVGLAAAATVWLATRIGMPVSTTHALVGGIVGVGLSGQGLHVWAVATTFFLPLLVAPALAIAIAAVVYLILRQVRLRLGVTRQTCVCIEREFHPVSVSADGVMTVAATGLRLASERKADLCFQRYNGAVIGLDAQQVLDGSHVLTAGAICFARGLNDTPKIAALMIAAGGISSGRVMVSVGVAMALGGLLAAKRVSETMSHRITDMNDGQAFSANLVTAGLVIVASKFGVPVSTTHVSCGSLFGIGLVNRQAHVKVIGQIVVAWIITLPAAAAAGWILWRLLHR